MLPINQKKLIAEGGDSGAPIFAINLDETNSKPKLIGIIVSISENNKGILDEKKKNFTDFSTLANRYFMEIASTAGLF